MSPILFEFELFGRTLSFNAYGLMVGLAFLTWAYLVRAEAARLGLKRMERGMTGTLVTLIASMFIGGKGLYALTVLGDDGVELDLEQGFVFWGAIIAATPAMIWRLKSLGVPILQGLDIFATPTPAGHALGRIGCFLAGCCYGHRCEQDWAVTFDHGVGLNHVPLHPVQLYEAGLLALLFLVLRYVVRLRAKAHGEQVFAYFALYSLVRCLTEMFRGDPGRRYVFGGGMAAPGDPPDGIATSVFISLAMALVGFVGWYLVRRRGARAR